MATTTPNPNDPKKPAAGAPATPGKPASAGSGGTPAQPGGSTPPARPATPGQQPPTGVPRPPQQSGTPSRPAGATPSQGTNKPAVQGPARPTEPAAGQAPGTLTAKPGTPAAKPSVGVPPTKPSAGASPASAKSAPKPAAEKPPARPTFTHVDSNSRTLGQKLIDLGYLDDIQVEQIYEEMRQSELKLGEIAINRGMLNDDKLLQALAEVHGLRVVSLDEVKPSPEAVKVVPKNMAEMYHLVPLSIDGDTLTVAISDPNNLQALDDIRNFLGMRQVSAVLSAPHKVEELLKKMYTPGSDGDESITSIIALLENDKTIASKSRGRRETSIDLEDLNEMANSAPVRKLINMVLLMAIRDHASDIHFEPFEDEYKMRYRCDGVLYEMVPPPRHLAAAIASRIKVMSNLDIAERRMPQDGRIELNVAGNPVDMRVSILPTMFGESVVIRVLDRSNVGLELERIGMPPDMLLKFREVIRKPNGIVLVTGPTGAGKTTTLYSALSELNDVSTKIITTEDPVEYEIDGICQCPINADIDMTFAAALRAILRQDPDVILVGEIRDLETAQIAIQASLTGHLVFSTLHTNDAPSSVTRLRDMGVEPYMITATVEAIEAQRLVRRVCTNCRSWYEPTREQLMELNLTPDALKGRKFAYGEGCDKCNNLGFKGRTGLYELLVMNDDLRDMVSRGASTDALRNHCRKLGVPSLRDSGMRALYEGATSLDEVVRETVLEDEG